MTRSQEGCGVLGALPYSCLSFQGLKTWTASTISTSLDSAQLLEGDRLGTLSFSYRCLWPRIWVLPIEGTPRRCLFLATQQVWEEVHRTQKL